VQLTRVVVVIHSSLPPLHTHVNRPLLLPVLLLLLLGLPEELCVALHDAAARLLGLLGD
jgi:hypothetical protein